MPSQGDVPLPPLTPAAVKTCAQSGYFGRCFPAVVPAHVCGCRGLRAAPAYSASCQVSREVAERSTRVTVIHRSRPAQPGSEAAAMSEGFGEIWSFVRRGLCLLGHPRSL